MVREDHPRCPYCGTHKGPGMNALLWTLVFFGVLNTLAVIFDRFETQPTLDARIISAMFTFALTLWAIWLLAKGAQ